ncbi:Arginine--tRNA ligase [Candidatus Bilamarchaeum dharawalense]|uniref:Arginine--tRNA ligase n=1 Tax=Candidatus Bilamarchaeum dharawalense TaxID=2885759 RepID=A0A5E4LQB0_9ARCH|nr:Arginine--tRNA ligase [Candidatus Bilamarchaeum dharawalense]
MLNQLKEEIAILTSEATALSVEDLLPLVELGKMGDLSSKVAFLVAKNSKGNPAAIASEIVKKLKPTKNFSKIEATGPYINFYLSDHAYSEIVSEILAKKENFGKGKKKKGKVIIEFPSVNPNKPWHIGHLRNALLGDSVARILEFDGHAVEKIDYIDDLGLQVAQSLWGFLNFDSNPEGKFDTWLGHQYVGIAKKFEQDKDLVEAVRNVLKSMEEGTDEIAQAGRALAENCVKAQYETSFNFGIYHDALIFESDILRTIFNEGIEYIKKNDAVVLEKEGKNNGCWVVKLSEDFEKEFGKMENPDKVLIRSDGTAVYTGKDVIFHLWKFGKLRNFLYEPFVTQPNGQVAYKSSPTGQPMDFGHAAIAINVIGVEQKYPQRVIVEVLRRLKFSKEAENLHHLSYEHVGLPDEKFSGRKGTWIGFTADELLAEANSRVMEKIKLDTNEDEKKQIAKLVGVAAIKFSFLRTGSEKRITFRWEDALNMEGDSGPYLQYAYVRANGILNKTEEKPKIEKIEFNDHEKKLIRKMAQLSEIVTRSSKERAPHHITQYGLELAADFSSFYTTSPVLVAEDKKTMKNRLAIVMATSIVLKNTLGLLGIECPERM